MSKRTIVCLLLSCQATTTLAFQSTIPQQHRTQVSYNEKSYDVTTRSSSINRKNKMSPLYYEKQQPFISSSSTTSTSSSTTETSLSATAMTASSSSFMTSSSASEMLSENDNDSTKSEHAYLDSLQQQQQQQQNVDTSRLATNIVPIFSASLLITSNTVGAGCLVLPELVQSGPGLLPSIGIFTVAYFINLLSGLMIAQIAITQKENSDKEGMSSDTPSSFKEFTRVNLHSDTAANIVSMISLFVNACVLSFDMNRIGTIGSSIIGSSISNPLLLSLSLPNIITMMWGTGIISLLCTQTSQRLSQLSNIFVSALFISFGGLLIPGLMNVNDPIGTLTSISIENGMESISTIAPIISMSMIYQNIVPTVTKLLNYNRIQTVLSIILGSLIPFVLYISWIYACLGHGIDTSILLGTSGAGESVHHHDIASSILLPIFSVVTIAGSSLCGGVSMSEEIESFFSQRSKKNEDITSTSTTAAAFQLPSAFISVIVPLIASIIFAGGNSDGNSGLTGALTLAGAFGSPLLYGAIPAYIAYQQLSQTTTSPIKEHIIKQGSSIFSKPSVVDEQSDLFSLLTKKHMNHKAHLVPAASLPMLGALSIGYVSQEAMQRVTEIFSFV